MATAPTDAVIAPDHQVSHLTAEQAQRRAEKLAARKERERNFREAKREAQAAEKSEPAKAPKRHRVVKNNGK